MADDRTPTPTPETAPRLEVGDAAPPLRLPDATGREVDLAELTGASDRVLVYVYPAAMTPGCTTETVDFQGAAEALAAAGIRVVGLSPDPPAKLARFAEKYSIDFPLLSDPEKTTLAAWGAFGEKKNYGKTVQGVIRSTFVVDPPASSTSPGTLSLARYNVRAKGHVAMVAGLLGVELPEPAGS